MDASILEQIRTLITGVYYDERIDCQGSLCLVSSIGIDGMTA